MNKQEILNYLAEKKRITAPVAIAEDNANKAERNYEKATKKWKAGIIVLGVCFAFWFVCGLLIVHDTNLFYLDRNGSPQIGGLGGSLLFGALLAIVLYMKQNRYVKPADHKLAEALSALEQAKSNPAYQNGAKDFPAKFYNYYDIYHLWNFINEGRADSLKEAYNLLETHQFQQDQMAIQEEIRRLQQDTATASTVTAAASVVNAVNSFRKK
ncbi:hypothetical protein [Lachnoclostridium sp. An76]|uniref:hypothetical protein n=1 Tax=Lachnoclostridium sp. An76 TaxID=1965654 RepID=UPI000B36A3F1|nr:hypothetical protein [Lachnoclostridium sp. An76]OUN33937.1 hypothetical protein B5G27_10715 [Lachnoclostridium sp. An76]